MEEIKVKEVSEVYNERIIAYMQKRPNAASGKEFWHVYPRYIEINGKWQEVDRSYFPMEGYFPLTIMRDSLSDVLDNDGKLAIVTITCLEKNENEEKEYKYFGKCFPGSDTSNVVAKKLEEDNLAQVIEINDSDAYKEFLKDGTLYEKNCYTQKIYVLSPSKDVLIGPFLMGEENIKNHKATALEEYNFYVKKFKYSEFSELLLTINGLNNGEQIILIQHDIKIKANTEDVDFIKDNYLIERTVGLLQKDKQFAGVQKNDFSEIKKEMLQRVKDLQDKFFTVQRVERIEKLLSDSRLIEDLAYYILKEDDLQKELVELIVANPQHVEKIKDEVLKSSALTIELADIDKKIEEKRKELEELQQSIESEKSKDKSETLDKLDKEIEEKRKILENLVVIQDLKEAKDKLLQEIEKLKKEGEEARVLHDHYSGLSKNVEEETNKIIKNFNQHDVIGKVVDDDLLKKILRGLKKGVIEKERQIVKFDTSVLENKYNEIEDIDMLRKAIIKDLYEYCNQYRSISKNDLINYIVCIAQGFITTFAGMPGSGKTSLCNLLACALGLCRDDANSRYVEVAVERGWTSHKDLIAYHNPLSDKLETSNEKMLNALEIMNDEGEGSEAPYLVLLDEANLSPIEHYWASYLKNCDFNAPHREISLGGNNVYKITKSLRFLATVNFDFTTEELSPRFLDRTWVIYLEGMNDIGVGCDVEQNFENSGSVMPFEIFKKAFTPTVEKEESLDITLKEKWENIKEIFNKNGMPIMWRSNMMVENYCKLAAKLLDNENVQQKYAALDYAFSQKILPSIIGVGTEFDKLMDELQEEVKSMPYTAKHVKRMIDNAKNNNGFYQFFAR